MRASEFITEAATSEVYHYASVRAALDIIEGGNFHLSSVTGNKSEEQYAPPGYPYFLSTTRSKVGDYHRWVGSSAAMFVLDGNWLNRRYKTKPVDYWNRSWLHSQGARSRESEDRVFSKEPEISIACVKSIHVIIKEQHEYRSPEVRKLLIAAKTRGIPAYLYVDENAWRLQNTNKSVSPGKAADLLKGQEKLKSARSPYLHLEPWVELIFKNKKEDLSTKADKLRYNLVYYGARDAGDGGLGNDMNNARKPNSDDYAYAIKINDYMRKNKMASTVGLKNALVKKWQELNSE